MTNLASVAMVATGAITIVCGFGWWTFLGIASVVITGFLHTIANGLFPVSQEEVDRYRYLYDKLEAEGDLPPFLKRF